MQIIGFRGGLRRAGWMVAAAAVLAVLPGEGAYGQPSGPVVRNVPPGGGAGGPVISVNFPGGKLSDYVQAIRRASPDQPINIAVQQRAMDVQVPPISVRDVTVYTALSALGGVAEPGENSRIEIHPVGSQVGAPESNPAFVVSVERPMVMTPQGPMSSGVGRFTRSISLREIIDGGKGGGGMAPEVILSAIEGIAQIERDDIEPALIKFHKDSGMLLIRGTQQQISAIEEVVDRLGSSVRRERSVSASDHAQEARRAIDVERAKINLQRLELDLKLATDHLLRTRESVAKGVIAPEEQEEAEARVQRAQQNIQLGKLELDAAGMGYAAPQDRPEAGGAESRTKDGDRHFKDLEAAFQDLQTENQALRQRVEELEKRGGKNAPKK